MYVFKKPYRKPCNFLDSVVPLLTEVSYTRANVICFSFEEKKQIVLCSLHNQSYFFPALHSLTDGTSTFMSENVVSFIWVVLDLEI